MIDALFEIIKGWHGFWQFVFLAVGGYTLVQVVGKLVRGLIRSTMVAIRGWPPEYLDADGDSIAEIVAKQEVKLAEVQKGTS